MAPLKLKLNTSGTTPTGAGSPGSVAQTPGSAPLKITFKQPGAPASATAASAGNTALTDSVAPKQKRKYTKRTKDTDGTPTAKSKKRAHDGDEAANPKRAKTKGPSIIIPPSPATGVGPGTLSRTPSISLKLKPKRQETQPKMLVIKAKGQKPERPLGVGYDSEAEDAEDDPAIESQLILRMEPGKDCDLLRKAIEERTIGEGFHVAFKFWDKEGRRVSVRIRNNYYAAILVDLPCIIEGTKSWDKKGWYKSADISQMLLVLGPAKDDKEVQNYKLPPEIQRVYDSDTQGLYQYPHGLTPPMHYVRKRRFRKRVSYRTIVAVEEEVERLIQADEAARASGGTTDYESIDPDEKAQDSGPDADEDANGDMDMEADEEMGGEAYGEVVGMADVDAEADDDDDDMMEQMMNELGNDDDQEEPITAVSANEAALHALGDSSNIALPTTETPGDSAGTPGGTDGTDQDDDDDDDDDDDGAAENEEVDEDELARQQEQAQLMEEVADLEKEVEIANSQHEQQKNPLLRKRAAQKLLSLKQDLAVKKKALRGTSEDE
ncbi:hypothetical protein EJ05DRAFT_479753 [Pseudovirgaria hyperparasitica]|uniref:TAFII55 protein conserved region domain-containing protein n=1 Tax=Pseudovirgaria hyperparasitica TaxID=470096 RepID=A0A6A6VUG9_9PEZI|nr:uncharacterized protein EJ05DRAFT_479753 [Pseudovirgaria hyperparasitica]KAF2754222.1 hypothetical protein EJ05DRAFT_479753 [Pseudovirgaria hyperparasitica]